MDIGIRELRDGLSRHLASVREGHTITVTDHGKPRIVPVGVPTKLEQLIAEGKVTPARRQKQPRPAPVKTGAKVSDLVDRQRRVIVYVDTSALVPLLIDEPTSDICGENWDVADKVTCTRLGYLEAAAALSMAERIGRISATEASDGRAVLDELWPVVDIIELGGVLSECRGRGPWDLGRPAAVQLPIIYIMSSHANLRVSTRSVGAAHSPGNGSGHERPQRRATHRRRVRGRHSVG